MVEYNVGGHTFSMNEIPKESQWIECTMPLTATNADKVVKPSAMRKYAGLRLLKSA